MLDNSIVEGTFADEMIYMVTRKLGDVMLSSQLDVGRCCLQLAHHLSATDTGSLRPRSLYEW